MRMTKKRKAEFLAAIGVSCLRNVAERIIKEIAVEYYCCGNTKIKITEHFAEDGKSMGELLEDLIIREAKKAVKD